jgi:hypothetical protein
MSLNNTLFKALLIGSLGSALTGHIDLREWLMRMHRAQVELTRFDWGRGGPFCTEFSGNYDSKTRKCGRQPLFQRKIYRPNR